MAFWLAVGILACGDQPEAPPPEEARVLKLGEDGPTLVQRRLEGRRLHNSRPDHPVTHLSWRGYEGHELFVDGESVGVLPVTKGLEVGPHTFEVLVGPGDKIAVEKRVVAKPGILVLELSR